MHPPHPELPSPGAPGDPRPGGGLEARLGPVLADLDFPARRWQIVAVADLYGADGVTRSLVDRLPERTYASLRELVVVLATVLSGRPVPAPATPGPPPHARRSGAGMSAAAPAALAARRRPARAPSAPSAPGAPVAPRPV